MHMPFHMCLHCLISALAMQAPPGALLICCHSPTGGLSNPTLLTTPNPPPPPFIRRWTPPPRCARWTWAPRPTAPRRRPHSANSGETRPSCAASRCAHQQHLAAPGRCTRPLHPVADSGSAWWCTYGAGSGTARRQSSSWCLGDLSVSAGTGVVAAGRLPHGFASADVYMWLPLPGAPLLCLLPWKRLPAASVLLAAARHAGQRHAPSHHALLPPAGRMEPLLRR